MRSRDEREKARRKRPASPQRIARLSVWLPADEMAALHARAAKQGRSETSLVRDAVRRLLGSRGLPAAKSRRGLKELLFSMPDVGDDADFERAQDHGRKRGSATKDLHPSKEET